MSTFVDPPRGDAVAFFDAQFARQARAGEFALNPFERASLPHLYGNVLDLGCGLGNLALAAARAGARVTALDASGTAIADLARRARAEGLAIEAHAADLRHYVPAGAYDCVVSIGLLMFFGCDDARALLARVLDAVHPGGLVALNVLVAGTTWTAPFGGAPYCFFDRGALARACAGWDLLHFAQDDFPADGGTLKCFETLVARRPAASVPRGSR